MPEFTNPFVDNVPPRKMTLTELVRAIRINMAAELDAASLYEAHADATDNPLARKVLLDIANEERVHVGELLSLSRFCCRIEQAWLEAGFDEVNEMAAEVARGDLEPGLSGGKAGRAEKGDGNGRDISTIGSMRQ